MFCPCKTNSKDMETFATGLKRIKDLCDEAGCKVEFRTEKDDFVVIFYRNLRETWKDTAILKVLPENKSRKLKKMSLIELPSGVR